MAISLGLDFSGIYVRHYHDAAILRISTSGIEEVSKLEGKRSTMAKHFH
jgi:hypothetical protein